MCGISGASFAPGSTVNRHKLLSSLLWASEVRGRDASGFAYVAPEGRDGLYKKNVPGSQLHVGSLPADASAFIAHTRAATHGVPSDNDNNHPVVSPKGTIRLVHNGVIYNHEAIREVLGDIGKKLPDVDSSVIPAMIEAYGLSSTEHLAGQAACAWFDSETGNTIHLAKFNSNPITFAWLLDGTFVFASTPEILGRALDKAGVQWVGVWPGPFSAFTQGDYIQVQDGDILTEAEVDWKTEYSWTGRDWSAQTNGGRSTYLGGTVSRGSENDRPMVLGSEETTEEEKPKKGDLVYSTISGGSVHYGDPANWPDPSDMSEEEYMFWLANGHLPGETPMQGIVEEENVDSVPFEEPDGNFVFYTSDADGDYSDYTRLSSLVAALSWTSKLSDSGEGIVGPDEGYLKWVNHILDVGVVDDSGSAQSWVRDPGSFEMFSRMVPSWVIDGVDKLRLLVGA